MFLVNGIYGIAAGTWALIVCTLISLVVDACGCSAARRSCRSSPAPSASTFGTLTLITGDAMWVQIKVTLFNALVALVLWIGLQHGPQLLPLRVRQDLPLHRRGLEQAHPQRGAVLPRHGHRQRDRAARLRRMRTSLRSTACSPASTSGSCSRSSSSCRSRALFFWWQVRLLQQYRLPEPVAGARFRLSAVSPGTLCGLNKRSNRVMSEEAKGSDVAVAAAARHQAADRSRPAAGLFCRLVPGRHLLGDGRPDGGHVVSLIASEMLLGRCLAVLDRDRRAGGRVRRAHLLARRSRASSR